MNDGNGFGSGFGNNFLDLLSMGSNVKNQNSQSADRVSNGFSEGLTDENFGSGSFKIRSKLDEIRDITDVNSSKLKMSPSKTKIISLGFETESEVS